MVDSNSLISAVREPLIKHKVNNYAGHRNIHPQRPGPARNRAVLCVASLQSPAQRNNRHGHNHNRQHNVSNQNCEIDGTRPSVTEKKNVADFVVKEYIAAQKHGRSRHRRDHARPVRCHLSPRNQPAASKQQDSAGSIQSRIEGREERVLLRDHAAGLVERRFTIRNARPNMARENSKSVAIDD